MKYKVKWHSKKDQTKCGESQPLSSLLVAKAVAEQKNKEYPQIHHYIVEVDEP